MMNNTLTNSTLYQLDPLIQSFSSPFSLISHIVNFCLAIPLNLYIIILLIRAGGLDGSAFYKLNLAATEIVLSIQTPLFILCFINVDLCFPQLITFFTTICLATRFIFQCCMCFEHYLAVVQPVMFLKYKSRKCNVAITLFMWMSSILLAIASAVHFSHLPHTVFGALFIMILSAHLFFFFSILRVLRMPGPGEKTKKDGGVSPIKKKALKSVSYSLLSFLIQFTPVIVALMIKSLLLLEVFYMAFIIALNINNAAGIVHPIFFLHQMGKVTFCVFKRQ